MKPLKPKIILILMIALSVLQFSLAMMMTHEGQENFCVFDEHCVLQSIAEPTEAVLPLYTVVLPIFFLFISLVILRPKGLSVSSPPPNFKFLQTLEGIVKRE